MFPLSATAAQVSWSKLTAFPQGAVQGHACSPAPPCFWRQRQACAEKLCHLRSLWTCFPPGSIVGLPSHGACKSGTHVTYNLTPHVVLMGFPGYSCSTASTFLLAEGAGNPPLLSSFLLHQYHFLYICGCVFFFYYYLLQKTTAKEKVWFWSAGCSSKSIVSWHLCPRQVVCLRALLTVLLLWAGGVGRMGRKTQLGHLLQPVPPREG